MRLAEHIQSGDEFKDLWVEGEVSQARVSPAGHVYFTLRDNVGQLEIRDAGLEVEPGLGERAVAGGDVAAVAGEDRSR